MRIHVVLRIKHDNMETFGFLNCFNALQLHVLNIFTADRKHFKFRYKLCVCRLSENKNLKN